MKIIILLTVLRALGAAHAEQALIVTNAIISESENASVTVDPLLIAAIAGHESNFNPKAVSSDGQDHGLMQLRQGVSTHLSVRTLHDPTRNVREGIRVLNERILQCGTLPKALAAYNTGVCSPTGRVGVRARRYVRAVLRDYEALRAASADRGT